MKLIFEAIKSLFRGVDSAIEQTAATLSKRIDKAQSTANKAQKNVATVQVIAEEAKATAEVQSDWNESDPNSPAYVENRTHYTEHYMRELEPAEYGPVAQKGGVYIEESNPDLAQVLERGIEDITVEYRFSSDAPWEEARSSVYTVSATDVRYYFQDQSGTYIFQYIKNNKAFYNNFSSSKDNLYIRVSGEVPDVRYVPLDVRFLPDDARTFHAWQYAGECNEDLAPVTVGAFSEMWICGRVSSSGDADLKLTINGVDLGRVGRVRSVSAVRNVNYVDVHIAAVLLDDDHYLIVSKYFYSTYFLLEGQPQFITLGESSTKVVSNASSWMTETNTVTLYTDIEVTSGALVRILIR